MPEQRNIPSNADKLLLPLDLLLDELVSAGFARNRVGTPLRLQLLDLLDTLPVETTPEQLKYKLSALICHSAEEQHKFYTLFEGFVERFRAQETAEPITLPEKKDDDAPAKTETPPTPPKDETPQKAPVVPKKGSHQTDSVKAARSGPITVALHFRDDGYRPWNLPELESVVRPMREKELTGAEEWDIPKTINQSIRAGGAPYFARRRRRKAPQYLFLIEQKSARDHLAGFYADLVSELSRRDLDAEYYFYDRIPRQCWKDRRDPSTYTTVDRLNSMYQQSRLILIGEADGLLAVSQVPGAKAEQVNTKIHLYPSELAFQLREAWPAVALLNTRSTPLWGDVETAIHQLFPVAPANAAGLGSLMGQWTNRTSFQPYYWKLENPEPVAPSFQHHDGDPETIQKDIKSLKSYLGRQGYTWLCAIAVYPEIYWQLTKILHDEAISAVDVPDESLRTQLWHLFLLRLSRLEWLRQGIIPAEYRNILRKDLPDANAVEVRRQLLEVLQLHENKPPEGSYAEKDRAYTVALFDHERYVTLEKPDDVRLAAMQEKLRQAVNDAGVAASDIEDAVGRSLFRSLPDMPAETVKNYWVLWVDDSPKNNESFQAEMTQEHAIQFVNATHTQQAFEMLQGQTFDLIISDVSRHGDKEAGIKMIRRFRENGITLQTLFFTHPNYVKQHRELLMGFGAVEVTSGFTQLRPNLLEALQQKAAGNVEGLKKIQFLEAAKQAGRAVCRVVLPDSLLGTGFLTQGNYLFTCSFLIDSPEKAKNTRVEFNVDQDAQGNPTKTVAYQLDPSDFMSSPVNNLDFTRVRIIDREDAPLSQWGYLDFGSATLPVKGEQVSIIHHLRGEAKQAELNEALGVEGQYFYYGENSPSSPGSSGAPVLNQDLEVVAMHRARKANTIILGEKRTVREAIVLKDVLAYIQKETPQTASSSPESEQILQADTLLEQGQAAYQNKDFEAAESFLQQALEVYTAAAHEAGRANAQHDLGKVLLATGRLEAAKQALDAALTIYYKLDFQSSQAFVLMDLGKVAQQLGEYDAAEQHYQEALERLESLSGDVSEDIVAVWQALGAISKAKGDLDAAKKRLLNALKESRKASLKALELPVLIQLGEINLALGDANQALGCFGDALELAENDAEKAEIQERLAEAQEMDRQPRKTIEALKKAADEGNVHAMNELGITYREAKRLPEAIEVLKKAADAGNIQSLNELGVTYREAKRLPEAIEVLKKAADAGNIQSLNELGITYREAKRLPEAIEVLKKAADAGNVYAMNELGITYREAKRLPEAIEVLKKAADAGNIQSLNELGITYREAKRLPEAIEVLKKAADAGSVYAMNELGITYREAKRLPEAIEVLKKATDAGYVYAMNELGITYREAKRLPEAIEVLKKAADAGNVYAMNELGITYREAKRLPEAIEVLKKATDAGYVYAMNELGITYREAKRLPEAIEVLKKAVALQPENVILLNELGITYREAKRLPEAIEALNEARTIYAKSGNTEAQARVTGQLQRLAAEEALSNVGDGPAEEVMPEVNPNTEPDNNKQQIQDLISQANLREALELLRKALPEDNTVVLLVGQLAALEENEIRGLINFDDASRTRAQISYAALELAGTLPDEKVETNKAEEKRADVEKVVGDLALGDKAEDFTLRNVDDTFVTLSSYSDTKGVLVIFTCNHCPYAQIYEQRIIDLHKMYTPLGVPVVAINPNSPLIVPEDSFEEMQKRAKTKKYPFVYLFDEDQTVTPKFGATRTPQVFLLDSNRVVKYIGAIDDSPESPSDVKNRWVEAAVNALLAGENPNPGFTRAVGCTIKKKPAKAPEAKQKTKK